MLKPPLDTRRIKRYLLTIRSNAADINMLLSEHDDQQIIGDRILLKALKYCLIELAEAMANTLQHLLARMKGESAESYLEVVEKATAARIIDCELLGRLTFFFRFRNLLIHRYWEIDDVRLIQEARAGLSDFDAFIEAVEKVLKAGGGNAA